MLQKQLFYAIIILIFAPIAQLDRVSGFEPEGCEFDSCWGCQTKNS